MLSFFCFVFEGELLGMEYLYSQTGKTLTLVLQNPEEEDRLVEDVDDEDAQDEGFEEENMEDITVPVLFEDDPLPHLENRPSSSMTSPQASPPQAPVSPTHLPRPPAELPSTSGSEGRHPAAALSVLPDTFQVALGSDSLSDEDQVEHFNGYFSHISIIFYFKYTVLIFIF